MSELPEPLVPEDVDLRGYEFMPLYGHHLFGSDFNAGVSDAAWRAALTLWWKAWNQVPAASLPDDDVALCRLADLGRDVKEWKKLRADALHGFVKCSDGRLYHRKLSMWALEAWDRRVKERERKAKWRASRERDKDVPETGTNAGQQAGHMNGHRRDVPAEGKGSDSEAKRQGAIKTKVKGVADAAAPTPAPRNGAGSRLPEGWTLPDEWAQWAIAERGLSPEEVAEVADGFRDHWHGKAGADARKADWLATWRNWVRREERFDAQRSNGSGRSSGTWWASEEATNAKARELGLTARAGESWQQFRGRIQAALDAHDGRHGGTH